MTGPNGPFGDGPADDSSWEEGGRDGGTPPHGVPVPRVPLPRDAVENGELGPPPVRAVPPSYDHPTLKSLLGAWALAACSAEESAAVEEHLPGCALCADEAARLRNAVELLEPYDPLDLDPMLRNRVLETCLGRRPPRTPVPEWAGPYDAEAARLDALLRSLRSEDWYEPVRLRWHAGSHVTSVAEVIGHLTAVDGLIAVALGLSEPLGAGADVPREPEARTEEYWRRFAGLPARDVREAWREQGNTLLRTVSFAGRSVGGLDVSYGGTSLPLRDAFLDRAFECWIHAGDIADAVSYPYPAPAPRDLHRMIDLSARMLPHAIADRRRAGLADSPGRLVPAGEQGRSLCLEVEGAGGGEWYIPLDSPAAEGSKARSVAHVALDELEFCQLAAGHRLPDDLAAGQEGDHLAIQDVLTAAAGLSRM